jgi:hypothetical protein
MSRNFQDLLKNVPEKPPRSKLEPYRELIRELRLKRWSYREIAALFEEQLKLAVAPSTLHNFVKVRAKQRLVLAIPPLSGVAKGEIAGDTKRPSLARQGKSQRFEFTPGEALKLSSKNKGGK